ncbi:Protein ZIP-4 c [Aphelenchoides avenae]|nr:Protein ZIP-4 c [Aphelenchus avenae]
MPAEPTDPIYTEMLTDLLENDPMMSSGGANQRMSQQNGSKQSQQSQDANFGNGAAMGGFEEWACEDFNLLDYVGNDPDNFFNEETDYNNLTEEESMHKNDLIYQTMQYNELYTSDHGHPYDHGYHPDGYADYQNHSYAHSSMDQSQMPSTSKSGAAIMTAPMKDIKDEPAYEMSYESGSADVRDKSPVPIEWSLVDALKDRLPCCLVLWDDLEGASPGEDHDYLGSQGARSREDSREPAQMHHGQSAASSTTSGSSANTPYPDGRPGTGEFVPKIKPRKYRMKPEQEKANPVYRVKREKNNDAVRRSRDKAKKHQQEKEERLTFLESEELKNKRLIAQLEERNKFLEKLLANCRCQASASSSSSRRH